MSPNKFFLKGKPINLAEECRLRALEYPVVYERIKRGDSVEDALSKPMKKSKSFTYGNKTGTLKEICLIFKFNYNFIANRLYLYKETFEEAVALHKDKEQLLKKRPNPSLKSVKSNFKKKKLNHALKKVRKGKEVLKIVKVFRTILAGELKRLENEKIVIASRKNENTWWLLAQKRNEIFIVKEKLKILREGIKELRHNPNRLLRMRIALQ